MINSKNIFKLKKNIFYNFLLFNFRRKKILIKKIMILFLLQNNSNKGNSFLIKIIEKLSKNSILQL